MKGFAKALWIIGVFACVVSPVYEYTLGGDVGLFVFVAGFLSGFAALLTQVIWGEAF